METLIDFDHAPVFAIPMLGGLGVREGMLIEGPQGWGEFSPCGHDGGREAARCLTAATEAGTVGWPDPVRGRIPVSVVVPAVDSGTAHGITARAGCRTADVTVAGRPNSLPDDIARVEAVRAALGPGGSIRCAANGKWDVDTAVAAIPALDTAAGGLEYVEQPCSTVEELAAVRRKVGVRIAAGEPTLLEHPTRASLTAAADIAVLRCARLGGVRRALRVAEACALPCVVSSPLESSVGLAAGLALAGALPELPFACALGTIAVLDGDLVAEARSLVPVDGHLPVAPTTPAPDPRLVKRYAVTDRGRIDWWRERLRDARTASAGAVR